MNDLIKIAVTITLVAASTGQLPKLIKQVHLAKLHLLKESQASKWPKGLTLPSK